MLHTGMLKGFMDGSLGSRTAAMKAPYCRRSPATRDLPRTTRPNSNKMTVERAQAGFQMGFHAIGDRAAAMALHAFATRPPRRRRATASSTPRWWTQPIPHSSELGVIASMQPNHLLTDMHWAE